MGQTQDLMSFESGVYNFRFRIDLGDDADDREAVMAIEAIALEGSDLGDCGAGWTISEDRRTLRVEEWAAEVFEKTALGAIEETPLGAIFEKIEARTGGPVVAAAWYSKTPAAEMV